MELFFAEHKKLWSRNYVKVSVLLCFVYIVVFGGILQYQWFSLGSSKDITGNHFDGYEYIRGRQEYARKYGPNQKLMPSGSSVKATSSDSSFFLPSKHSWMLST